ncbi:MAG: AbrB/MazE/SpoVT family DNA-binding domain-containing protein [Candidatus Nanohalobium sp.]
MEVNADDGRIYIPKEIREKRGTEFELIDRGDKIILIPIEDDPLEAMRNELGDIEKSVDELKKGAMETAMEEAGK